MTHAARVAARGVLWSALLLGPPLAPLFARADAPRPAPSQVDTAPSLSELTALQANLASPDAAQREQAFDTLRSLAPDALPAIARRLESIQGHGFDATAVLSAMSELRRSQGVAAPNGDVDLALGVLPLLARSRDRASVLAAELVALLRALEAQKTPEASELIVGKLFALDSKLFRYEAQRTRARLGVLLIPALIRHQTHPRSWIRSLCVDTLLAMGVDKPGRAVQQDDVALLSAILASYGNTLNFEAMPVVVSYVTDERVEVRDAARAAVARFGKNAIWQLRERYLNATGKEADPSWSYQRLLADLARTVDAPKRVAFEAQRAAANAALDADDFAGAQQALDTALIESPHGELAVHAAPLYERLAAHFEAEQQFDDALSALRRALRLDPAGEGANRIKARIDFLEAELRLAQGQVDVAAYQRALALDPALSAARETLDELTGERARRDAARRKTVGLAAATLLVGAAFMVLRGSRRRGREPEEDAPSDADGSQPG